MQTENILHVPESSTSSDPENELIWCSEALAPLFTDAEIMATFVGQRRSGPVRIGGLLWVVCVSLPGKQVPQLCDSGHSSRNLRPSTDSELTSYFSVAA